MRQSRKNKAAKGTGAVSSAQAPSTQHAPANGTFSAGAGNGNLSHGLQARIATLAYELYERRGRADGYDMDDWLRAEELITMEDNHARGF